MLASPVVNCADMAKMGFKVKANLKTRTAGVFFRGQDFGEFPIQAQPLEDFPEDFPNRRRIFISDIPLSGGKVLSAIETRVQVELGVEKFSTGMITC
jgi:hypothetical protein